ncbi:Importin subunit beta-1 [Colletotrichum higginsianum IMI 349063]|uniref:Importin-95 n=4 Tax=Colletotrichum destructivum species complex TaxID=2707350 RepID=A0A1B7Y932_COLHI|nr:Importin subunit beta-1 [Colletotrichum higginsianum IMI 349063]OBR08490.1 Importin subunit beta-1 [Colletotrichum higginsianum IMI 349063]TIC95108.1 Importin subunit beta-1 [Colletotrichum higginsianum]GJC97434.1 importin subunit beta1 [Colletotrichum higginsianum]
MSSSEINQVLANSLSPDANLRNAAEQQLTQAADNNFPLYLATLVQELANDSADGSIRAAAGLALKNAFTARDFARHQELQAKWLQQTDDETKTRVKDLTLQTLSSSNAQAGQAAAQVISSIASIELPRGQWQDLMGTLVKNVSEGGEHQKQASLTTIGYICESQDPDLRTALITHSNAILTAVVQGARKEETSLEVRLAAITALGDSLEFVGNNFKHEGERNYIMQVVCEATQADDSRIQQGAFGCLNRIMGLYYDNMRFYMEKALFGLTILGMKSSDEDVAKLAVEFWSTVCEEEIGIEDDNTQVESADQMRPFYNFARVAANEVVPVLLLLLTKQDEDAADDEYNLARAAYQCLALYAQAIGAAIISPVLQFVEGNLRAEDWHHRDAAVSAFGAIMDGPDEKVLDPIVKQALPILIGMMDDSSLHVKDSTAYALGRITESVSDSIDPNQHLDPLIRSLFNGLMSNAKIASSCCWALMNLAERFSGDLSDAQNPLTPHFNQSVTNLLALTARPDCDSYVRTAAYEVLNVFVQNAASESMAPIASLSGVIIERLEGTIPMQSQVVSVEDRIMLEEMQTSLCTVLQAIIQRLDKEIIPQGDRIMQTLLQILSTVGSKSSVPDGVFATISALANAMEEDFSKYMEAFTPFLYNALSNQEEPSLCSMAIGLVSDLTRSLGERSQPYCDNFMNHLLHNLKSTALSNQFKPAILQCFGDIAGAIGGHFETYLSVIAQVLQQAATVNAGPEGPYEMYDYVISLREGIMDAWGGIIGAMKSGNKTPALQQYVPSIFQLLNMIASDMNRSEALMRASMGVIGDLADAYPNGELVDVFRQEWLTALIKETKTNREFQPRTIETARWAREQVKRQLGGSANVMSQT